MFNKSFKLLGESFTITPLFLILLAVTLLRIPSLFEPYWYGDEGIYLTLGEGVRQGVVLYRDLFDHKPPLLYWVAALAGSVFWFRFILLAWHLATVALFWKLSKKLFKANNKAVLLSNVFFALFTTIPLLEGHIANAELFMIGTTILAFNILLPTENLTTKKLLWGGIILSLSFLFKVPSVFDFLVIPFVWLVYGLSFKTIKESFSRSFALGIGFIIPILFTLIYYGARGALVDYLNTAGFFNTSYIASWEGSASSKPSLLTTLLAGGFQTRALVLVLVTALLTIFRNRFDKTTFFAVVWLVFSTFAMLLSGRPYPHYILQAIPPLALVTGIVFFGKQSVRFLPVPVLAIFLYSLVFYKFYSYPTFPYYANFLSFITKQESVEEYRSYFGNRVNRTYKLASMISSRTTKKDRIFIWGTLPELYALSRRIPPVKYTTSFHIKDLRVEASVMQSLAASRPKYIIKLLDAKETLPGLDEFLFENYVLTDEIEDAEIWRSIGPRVGEVLN